MTARLLNRQIRLLEYLTSRGAIFGGQDKRPPELEGIDHALLGLEARFSYEKRMEKIAGVLPATFELLGANADKLMREFADACPPYDISRIENARQFHGLIVQRGRAKFLTPPYLADVAACELACAEARMMAEAAIDFDNSEATRPAIRRRRGVVLLRTAFDIRCIFERADACPPERETCLAVTWVSGEPRALDLPPQVFDVLAALDRWTALDELPGVQELTADLMKAFLLEVRH